MEPHTPAEHASTFRLGNSLDAVEDPAEVEAGGRATGGGADLRVVSWKLDILGALDEAEADVYDTPGAAAARRATDGPLALMRQPRPPVAIWASRGSLATPKLFNCAGDATPSRAASSHPATAALPDHVDLDSPRPQPPPVVRSPHPTRGVGIVLVVRTRPRQRLDHPFVPLGRDVGGKVDRSTEVARARHAIVMALRRRILVEDAPRRRARSTAAPELDDVGADAGPSVDRAAGVAAPAVLAIDVFPHLVDVASTEDLAAARLADDGGFFLTLACRDR